VLLIDDTWTTGGSVQAAACALKHAGARRVGVVVIGRHINREYGENDERLRELPPFSWDTCAVHV
jgi:orotate phosphoribosyltransferase